MKSEIATKYVSLKERDKRERAGNRDGRKPMLACQTSMSSMF